MPYGTVAADVIQNTTGYSLGAGNASIMKNRIINGAMVIDQRNAGASVTLTTTTYTLDRFAFDVSQASKISCQQNAGSVTPPVGFTNYLGVTSLAATTVGASDYYQLYQNIEGFNSADLQWGTANAKTVTLSFWVRASVTGSYGGAIRNSAQDRSYPFSYTVSSANTWELKSVTIAGDTTGTWIGATNGVGIRVFWGMGMGSTFTTTGGAWTAGTYGAPTGSVNMVSTNGATFYITGVQLEVGSSSTGFEYVNYQTSLANCQRYYARMTSGSGAGTFKTAFGNGISTSTSAAAIFVQAPVTMRAFPTFNYFSLVITDNTGYDVSVSSVPLAAFSNNGVRLSLSVSSSTMVQFRQAMLVADYGSSSAGYVEFTAEL